MRTILSLIMLAITSGTEQEFPPGVYPGSEKPAFRTPQDVRPVEASPTPMGEVNRVLGMLPKPEVAFVDFGCGSDARWCIAAARKWGRPVIGIEINPERAAQARANVNENGLDQQITILEGDATEADVEADVGVAYLYDETLTKLRPRITKMKAFASYMHQVPGLAMSKNGDTYIYTKSVAASPKGAVWNGMVYSGPVCNNPNCSMCNSIRSQLSTTTTTSTAGTGNGYWVKRCNNGRCWMEWVPQ